MKKPKDIYSPSLVYLPPSRKTGHFLRASTRTWRRISSYSRCIGALLSNASGMLLWISWETWQSRKELPSHMRTFRPRASGCCSSASVWASSALEYVLTVTACWCHSSMTNRCSFRASFLHSSSRGVPGDPRGRRHGLSFTRRKMMLLAHSYGLLVTLVTRCELGATAMIITKAPVVCKISRFIQPHSRLISSKIAGGEWERCKRMKSDCCIR